MVMIFCWQKVPARAALQIRRSKTFYQILTEKHLCRSLPFRHRLATLSKKIFWQKCLPVKFGKLFRKVILESTFNPFMHNIVKWPNILQKSCSVHTARFLKYVWPFYNIMHDTVKRLFCVDIELKVDSYPIKVLVIMKFYTIGWYSIIFKTLIFRLLRNPQFLWKTNPQKNLPQNLQKSQETPKSL